MNNRNFKKLMTRGNPTGPELYDVLFGAGGGNNEQYNKVHVSVGGQRIDVLDMQWIAEELPAGAAKLDWETTSQSCDLDRETLQEVLYDHADGKATSALREVEGQEEHGSTKTLPKNWSIGEDGATLNQFGEAVN